MRDVILLLKAASALRDKSNRRSKKMFIGILLMFTVMNIVLISISRQDKDYSSIVINFFNMVNFSTLYVITFGNLYRVEKGLVKNDFLQFVAQLPVSKRSFSYSKFILIWLGLLPSFAVLVYQNIICYIRGLDGFSGYIGLCTILVCFQLLILCFIAGFNSYYSPKNTALFSFIPIGMIFILAVGIFASMGLEDTDIYYGIFGTGAAGIFQKLEILSGSTGGVFVTLCIIVAYLLCCILPDKIYSRKGWSI